LLDYHIIFANWFIKKVFLEWFNVIILNNALIDNWIQRISHFMWYCGIYQAYKFLLSFDVIVKYFGRYINKLKSVLLVPIFHYSCTSFDLKVKKCRQKFSWYIFHVRRIGNYILKFWVFHFLIILFFTKCKYTCIYFILWHFNQIINRKFLKI
jgi:hypothetical protein